MEKNVYKYGWKQSKDDSRDYKINQLFDDDILKKWVHLDIELGCCIKDVKLFKDSLADLMKKHEITRYKFKIRYGE